MKRILYPKPLHGALPFLLILLFLFQGVWVVAQNITVVSDKVLKPDLLFESFHNRDGLPDDRIRSLFQDHKGHLWIGTMNGVAKYDGYGFKKYYKKRFSNSISGNWAYAITEDTDHNIWIGTREGLNKFDTKKLTFESFVHDKKDPQSISSNVVNTFHFDKQGKLWIGTPHGLNRFDTKTKTFQRFNSYPFNNNICNIIASKGDFIWIATNDGVIRYNTGTNTYRWYKIPVQPNPYGDRFWSMVEEQNDLYLGSGGDGLIKLPYNSNKKNYDSFEYLNDFDGGSLEHTEIFSICKASNGDFWLGTTGSGLAKIEKINTPQRKITFYKSNVLNNQSISNNRVYKVFIDRSNVLWCGTDDGLNKLDLYQLPFQYYTFSDKSKKDQIRTVYSVDGKTVWLGTSKSGLIQYNTNTGEGKSVHYNSNSLNANRSLLLSGNDVWNGTLNGVLKTNQSLSNSTKTMDGHAVFALLKDSKRNVWVGTNNGLYKIKPDGSRINYLSKTSSSHFRSTKFVRSLFEDHKGNIWIGFENSPVAFYNPKTGRFITLSSKKDGGKIFFSSIVYSITEYPKNVIWTGSESGLNKITTNANGQYVIKNYSEENGLLDKSVNSMLPDNKGNLWIGTIKGLVKFNIKKESFQNYLSTTNFNSSSSIKVNEHCFLFACYDGFVKFDPTTIKRDLKMPKVFISDLKVYNKSVGVDQEINGNVILKKDISVTDEIDLCYNNQFTIEFTALHFSNPENNVCAYKLDGFDEEWIYANAKNRSATYTNLDPGTYTFMVKSSNYEGNWNSEPHKLKITILPPPWKTWWAFLVYLIVFNGIVYLLMKYILLQSKQRNQIRFEQKEKEQLKNLNQMKVRFFTDISHEFRTPLSLIIGPVEDILNAQETNEPTRNKLKLIYRNCTKLLYLLDELMTFQKMEQGMLKLNPVHADLIDFVTDIYENFKTLAVKKDIKFNLITPKEPLMTDFDPRKMEMILNNLLFNAFKFSKNENGSITIKITEITRHNIPQNADIKILNWICIAIEDNGKGLTTEEFRNLFQRFSAENAISGSGVGLSLTKNLVELHHGVIVAESEFGVKTTFKVYIPHQSVAKPNATNYKYISEYDLSKILYDAVAVDVTTISANEDPYIILVVDDNPEVLDYLEMTFRDDYKVAKAQNGVEAMQYIEENLPDLVISDVMMPEMDGVALCKAMKTNSNTCHIPLILLTAKSTVEDQIEGLQTGADDYIPKPFHPNVLKSKVENIIRSQKRIVEKFKADGGVIIPKNIAQNPLNEKFLNMVIQGIKSNMSNDEFSVEELGSIVAMSRSNLFRKLKSITGQTPIEFIYFIRLKHAMELLLERKRSISEIAYEVGFKNPSSFTKSFKKHYGKSPSDYLNDLLNS